MSELLLKAPADGPPRLPRAHRHKQKANGPVSLTHWDCGVQLQPPLHAQAFIEDSAVSVCLSAPDSRVSLCHESRTVV